MPVKQDSSLPAESLTHEHIAAILYSETERYDAGAVVRILDAGCDVGRLIVYLSRVLPTLCSDLTFEVYGYDISDHVPDRSHFLKNVISSLEEEVPTGTWSDRIMLISSEDKIPFADDFFDVVVSNQVLEHVYDPHFFLSEVRRVLKHGGFSANLFPLKHYIWEGHLHLPFVHRIREFDTLKGYIALLSLLGLGNYSQRQKEEPTLTRAGFAEFQADYMNLYTNYISYGEVLKLGKACRLRTSFRYTASFYFRKARQVLGLRRPMYITEPRSALVRWFLVLVCRYISSITLFVEKESAVE